MNSSVVRGGFALESCSCYLYNSHNNKAVLRIRIVYSISGPDPELNTNWLSLDPDPKHKNYIQNGKTTS